MMSFLLVFSVVTREIVQPAKASNFSENRLLKRASPHDTETIYQLFLSFLIFHYSLALEDKLVLVKMNNDLKKGGGLVCV